jgi:hypothetical protein
MSEHEHEQPKPSTDEREETIEDLEVTEGDAEDVKGGLGQRLSPVQKK